MDPNERFSRVFLLSRLRDDFERLYGWFVDDDREAEPEKGPEVVEGTFDSMARFLPLTSEFEAMAIPSFTATTMIERRSISSVRPYLTPEHEGRAYLD